MKILITGNSGYIGSHLTQLLNKRDDLELYGLDRNKPIVSMERFSWNDITMPGYFMWTRDVEFDCVIHLAAEVSVGPSIKNPIKYYQTNIMGTLRILQDIKFKRFIHASTGSAGPMINPYGISKRAAEDIVDQYCKEKEIPFTTFRFYNVTGTKNLFFRADSLVAKLTEARNTGVFNLYGDDYNTIDGSAVRDYTHVDEICNAVEKAIDTSTNRIENLGHGVGTTVKQMIELYKKVNNCDFEIKICPRRPGDLEKSVLDNPSTFMQKMYSMEDLLWVP
jgi:UDP-glucose 4-epimerase